MERLTLAEQGVNAGNSVERSAANVELSLVTPNPEGRLRGIPGGGHRTPTLSSDSLWTPGSVPHLEMKERVLLTSYAVSTDPSPNLAFFSFKYHAIL
jgi:hypothetical protein